MFFILLPVYKSFIFKKTQFITERNVPLQIKYIVEALNIKKRKKRIEFIYDKSCEILDNHYPNTDICGFKNNQCYAQQGKDNTRICGCCRRCIYQSCTGCKTKNLACKLFNCAEVRKRYKVLEYKDLKILKVLNLRQRLIVQSDFFSSREEVLKDLYSYSFIYSVIKISMRLFKNQF